MFRLINRKKLFRAIGFAACLSLVLTRLSGCNTNDAGLSQNNNPANHNYICVNQIEAEKIYFDADGNEYSESEYGGRSDQSHSYEYYTISGLKDTKFPEKVP